jgi:hypothetical protein
VTKEDAQIASEIASVASVHEAVSAMEGVADILTVGALLRFIAAHQLIRCVRPAIAFLGPAVLGYAFGQKGFSLVVRRVDAYEDEARPVNMPQGGDLRRRLQRTQHVGAT